MEEEFTNLKVICIIGRFVMTQHFANKNKWCASTLKIKDYTVYVCFLWEKLNIYILKDLTEIKKI